MVRPAARTFSGAVELFCAFYCTRLRLTAEPQTFTNCLIPLTSVGPPYDLVYSSDVFDIVVLLFEFSLIHGKGSDFMSGA